MPDRRRWWQRPRGCLLRPRCRRAVSYTHLAVFGFEDAVALPGQKDAHAVPDVRVILYDHDGPVSYTHLVPVTVWRESFSAAERLALRNLPD